jgi:hypothetical protein
MSPVVDRRFNAQLFYARPKDSARWPVCIDLASVLRHLPYAHRTHLIQRLKTHPRHPALVTTPRTKPKPAPAELRDLADDWPGSAPQRASRRARPNLDWAGARPPPFTFEMARALLRPRRDELKKLLASTPVAGKRKKRQVVVAELDDTEADAMMADLAAGVALSGHLYSELDQAASKSRQHANLKALLRLRRVSLRQLYRLDGATFTRIMSRYPGGELAIRRRGLEQAELKTAITAALADLGSRPSNRPSGSGKRYRRQLALTLANVFAHHRGELVAKSGYKPPRGLSRDYRRFVDIVFKALPWRWRTYGVGRHAAKNSIALAREGLKQRKLALERVHQGGGDPRPDRLGVIDPSDWYA